MEIKISGIEDAKFNPFLASREELIANALGDAGLLANDTKINGKEAGSLCKLFYAKRESYKKLTRVGGILVKKSAISTDQLKKALCEQKKKRYKKLGDILVDNNYCTKDAISEAISAQANIRSSVISKLLN